MPTMWYTIFLSINNQAFFGQTLPKNVIEYCLKAAGTAPSGANQQPWHFVAVSDPVIKHRIREAAEKEE